MKFEWNPLQYGDALGLTYGPLSGRAPGKLTESGIDLQQIANPFVPRSTLEQSNDIAPYVAGAIAGGSFFGGLSGGGGSSTLAGEGEALGPAPMTAPTAFAGNGEALGANPMTAPVADYAGSPGGAFDMSGSQGVFDSQGNPLYKSPARSVPQPNVNFSRGGHAQMQWGPIDQSMDQGYASRLADAMRRPLSTSTSFGYGPALAQAMRTTA